VPGVSVELMGSVDSTLSEFPGKRLEFKVFGGGGILPPKRLPLFLKIRFSDIGYCKIYGK
jgi:hypothetical protein